MHQAAARLLTRIVGHVPVLVCSVAVLFAACSDDSGTTDPSENATEPPGYWNPAPNEETRPQGELSQEELDALAAIGYVGGSQAVPTKVGVVRHDPQRAYDGYNLYASGHGPEAVLTDMEGRVLHAWQYDASDLYPVRPDTNYWRRVHLDTDGSLLALFDPHGLIKLDKDSNLIWATDGSILLHHDFFVTDSGDIYAIGRDFDRVREIHSIKTLIDDFVVHISPEGEVVDRFSILDAFRDSAYWDEIKPKMISRVNRTRAAQVEAFHTNTIQVFDGSQAHLSELFGEGNMLFCSPWYQNVWIIDAANRTVAWNWFGPWKNGIHEATLLDGGRLLLFDNHMVEGGEGEARSQVLEYDLLDRSLVWRFAGDPGDLATRFYSGSSSTVQRLRNGNTLAVVTESGRAIEVTPAKEIVWEFFNPKRAGDRQEYIASLFQLERLPAERVEPWLDAQP